MIGTVLKANPEIMQHLEEVGVSTNKTTGEQYTSFLDGHGTPSFMHEDGRVFVLRWEVIAELAEQAFAEDPVGIEWKLVAPEDEQGTLQ